MDIQQPLLDHISLSNKGNPMFFWGNIISMCLLSTERGILQGDATNIDGVYANIINKKGLCKVNIYSSFITYSFDQFIFFSIVNVT